MAIIQKAIDAENDLTVFTLSGQVLPDEILDTLLEFYADKPTNRMLWDFSQADVPGIKMEDLEEILEKIIKFKDLRPKGKTALVTDKDYAFGIGRMYDSLVEISEFPVEHRVFRDFNDAMQWIMQTA